MPITDSWPSDIQMRPGLRTAWAQNDGAVWYCVYSDLDKDAEINPCGIGTCLHYGLQTNLYHKEVELSPEEAAVLKLQGKICCD